MPDLGQALVEQKIISEPQLQDAKAAGGSLATALIDKKIVDEAAYVSAVCQIFGVEEAQVDSAEPDPEAIALIPEALYKQTGCLPLKKAGAMLHVAIADPGQDRTIDKINRQTGLTVKAFAASPKAIEKAAARFYGKGGKAAPAAPKKKTPAEMGPPLKEIDAGLQRAVQEVPVEDAGEEDTRDLVKLEINELDPPVVRVVSGILMKALKMRASDIHIETLEEELRVRVRVDGAMVEILRLPEEMKNAIVSRVKIMANMDIAEKRVPQDGGIKALLEDGSTIDFRASCLPNIYGEKIVMRVLGTSDLKASVDDLGFEGRALELVREAVASPYGMILVTGPTGSGKTTTLYTILNQLNQPDTNIVTAEDPVEYRLEGITQVNVRHSTGLTFDAAMRSFLRQDPDIILVGEMRDFETAAIAVKAALTGHLVLSTLHTNDAPSTAVRLVDMGIEPYLVASAVKLIVAQRLLRRICQHCKEAVDMAEAERTDLDQTTLASVEYMYRGKGCEHCNNLGYRGRVPVFEVMAIKTKDMKRAITEGGTEVQVAQIAKREGMMSLSETAIDLVNKGVTTLEEAMSIIIAE